MAQAADLSLPPHGARPLARLRPRLAWATALAALLVAGAAAWAFWPGRTAQPEPSLGEVCLVAPASPYDPASGLPPTAAREVPEHARCPVCGMYPARSRPWAAQVIFRDGDAHFFDSPLSLLMYLQDVGRYSRGRHAQDVVAAYVTDHATGRWADARTAYYVDGSSARGPMRAGNLPAFATAGDAQAHVARAGGRVLRLAEVDAALLRRLSGGHGHRHPH